MKLTAQQREVLSLLADGPRDGITHRGTVNALERIGLVSHAKPDNGALIASWTWTITPAGRAALESRND